MNNDLIGQRFNSLVVVERAPTNGKNRKRRWICMCDCGSLVKTPITTNDLRSGKVKSCGCYRRQSASRQGKMNASHGMTGTRLWNIWQGMKDRCKRNKNYSHVHVCAEWADFQNFYHWAISNGYTDSLTIDRIDPSGDYSPRNCRWVDWKVQENNRRNNFMISYNGDLYSLSQLSEKIGIPAPTLRYRVLHGWREDEYSIPVDLNNKNKRKCKKC